MPEYDLESMRIVAGKISAIADRFTESKDKVTGIVGPHPFGGVRHPDDHDHVRPSAGDHAAAAVQDCAHGTRAEFSAGADLMTAASGALGDAIKALAEQERAHGDAIRRTDRGER